MSDDQQGRHAAGVRADAGAARDERTPARDAAALEAVVAALRADPGAFPGPAAVAAAAGFAATELDALCREHFHATPAALLAAARCEHAQRLLAAGAAVADAAAAAGFAALSTFAERFQRATGMTPGAYRDLAAAPAPELTLTLPAGYLPGPTLRAWGRDPRSLSERVDGDHIVRALRGDGDGALLHVELAAGLARCRLEAPRPLSSAARYDAHRTATRMLGFPGDAEAFERQALRAPRTAALVAGRRGLRIPLTPDPFEALTWAVLGQQVNLAFAFTLRRQVLELAGGPAPGGLRSHPEPAAVAALDVADLVRRQLSRRKAEYLVGLAAAAATGELPLAALAGASAVRLEETLVARRGVGPWTARYVMLRGYGLADCVPVGDAGLTLALQRFHDLPARPDATATEALMAPFAPFRSFATFHFWASLAQPAAGAALPPAAPAPTATAGEAAR